MWVFVVQKKVTHALKDRKSPVLLEVINSCDIKVSFSGYHSLVFGLAFDCSFIAELREAPWVRKNGNSSS